MSTQGLRFYLGDEGISLLGVEQLLKGQAMTDPKDRQALRQLLIYSLQSELPPHPIPPGRFKGGEKGNVNYTPLIRSALLKRGLTEQGAAQISMGQIISDGGDRQALILMVEQLLPGQYRVRKSEFYRGKGGHQR